MRARRAMLAAVCFSLSLLASVVAGAAVLAALVVLPQPSADIPTQNRIIIAALEGKVHRGDTETPRSNEGIPMRAGRAVLAAAAFSLSLLASVVNLPSFNREAA